MSDGSNVGYEPKPPIWPQDGATAPSFESPETAAAFVAESVGLAFEDLAFRSTTDSPLRILNSSSAWFPGIPQTSLIFTDPTEGLYNLTEGAADIVRNIQKGDYAPQQLITPYDGLPKYQPLNLDPAKNTRVEATPADSEENQGGNDSTLSVEQRLSSVADFMRQRGISAVLIQGTLDDGRSYEGVSLMGHGSNELGDVVFSEGKALIASVKEHRERLEVSGLTSQVVRPLQRAVHELYKEGCDLLDERFNVLPGF